MPALPLEVLWTVSLLTFLIGLILYGTGRRSRWTAAGVAARGHLMAASALTVLATGVWAGPAPLAGAWLGDSRGGWHLAGGVPASGRWSTEALDAAPVDATATALAVLLPVLWLVLVPALAQVTWPRVTAPRRTAGLIARRWPDLFPVRLRILLVAGLGFALAGAAAATTGPGVQGARYRLHVGADAVPFGADFPGAPSGSAVAGWYALSAAAVVLACAAVVVVVHHRPMLSGLSPAADLAARRVAVDRTVRIGVAQLCWIGLAAVAGRLEVAARATAADAAAAAFEAQQAGAISTPELVDRLRELDPASPATTLLLGGAVAVILVLALLKPYRDLQTLRADAAVPHSDTPVAAGRG